MALLLKQTKKNSLVASVQFDRAKNVEGSMKMSENLSYHSMLLPSMDAQQKKIHNKKSNPGVQFIKKKKKKAQRQCPINKILSKVT